MRGLYLHIPFCKTRCHYCNFVTTAEHASDLRERFFKALSAEIKHACERYGRPPGLRTVPDSTSRRTRGEGPGGLSFDTLYLGGGTPSSLSIPELRRLVEEVQASFRFSGPFGDAGTGLFSHSRPVPMNECEFTCEFNPGDGTREKLETLRTLGVNRISLGGQSFRDEILQRIGRRHTARDIAETVSKIREAGIANISFDLMLRLPGQTVEDFRDSVKKCIELDAAQVSLYDLEVHEETPFGQFQKEGKLNLPGEEDHARMYESAIELLTGAGYEHYEISNFAKPGLASRHNLIYWHNQEYLGLGPGAFTYLGGIRSQFAPDLARYLEKCEAKDWKSDMEDKLAAKEKETETLVTGLRLREGVRPASFPKIYPALKDRLQILYHEGLLEISGENSRLTTRGKFLSEDVFAFLLQKGSRPTLAN